MNTITQLMAASSIGPETARNIVQDVTGGQLPDSGDPADSVGTVVNAVLFFAGFVAITFIVIGGFRYVTSAGDPQKTAQAKDTILYAVIGLIIAIAAFTIVNLVIGAAQS